MPRSFGAAHNAECMVPCATMLDFYNGGGVDITCLGAAEVDAEGNVNVHSFPGRQPGCGGFIDISQAAKKVIFAGTFTAGSLKVALHSPVVNGCFCMCRVQLSCLGRAHSAFVSLLCCILIPVC